MTMATRHVVYCLSLSLLSTAVGFCEDARPLRDSILTRIDKSAAVSEAQRAALREAVDQVLLTDTAKQQCREMAPVRVAEILAAVDRILVESPKGVHDTVLQREYHCARIVQACEQGILLPVYLTTDPKAVEQLAMAKKQLCDVIQRELPGIESTARYDDLMKWIDTILSSSESINPTFKFPVDDGKFQSMQTELNQLTIEATKLDSSGQSRSWADLKEPERDKIDVGELHSAVNQIMVPILRVFHEAVPSAAMKKSEEIANGESWRKFAQLQQRAWDEDSKLLRDEHTIKHKALLEATEQQVAKAVQAEVEATANAEAMKMGNSVSRRGERFRNPFVIVNLIVLSVILGFLVYQRAKK